MRFRPLSFSDKIDEHTGSLKTGKDADVVVWSDNPLSIYAKAEMIFVDGIKFFDRAEDLKMRDEKKEGGKTRKPSWKGQRHYHCDSDWDEGN